MQELFTQIGPDRVAAFFLVLARVSPLFVLAPLFSSKSIPGRVKGVIAVALAIGLSPIVSQGQTIPVDAAALGYLMAKELLIGAAFAFALGALHAAIQTAGALLDVLIGFSYGGTIDPLTGTQSSVLTQMYGLIGVLVFIAIGGEEWVIMGLERTYDLVSLTQMPSLGLLVDGAVQSFVHIFVAAVQVAGPVILALILTDAAVGVVSRIVPQLNVFAVGFPAKVLVGLLLIGVSLPFFAGWVAEELQRDVSLALRTLRVA